MIDVSERPVCLDRGNGNVTDLARQIYSSVCRVNFDALGVSVLDLGEEFGSVELRRLMVDLKREMARLHETASGKTLHYLSLARFDQQTSTKPHLDGGPDECFLMLGYEPTEVDSEFEIFDYSRCAFDLGITPREFLARHNPMFEAGYEMLKPFAIDIPCFTKSSFQIVCINNSSLPYSDAETNWLGVLHTANIPSPDLSQRRVINSTMIASVSQGDIETVSREQQEEFVTTSVVRRRNYESLELQDDQ